MSRASLPGFAHNARLTQLYVNSIKTYLEAERGSGQSVGFHRARYTDFQLTREECLELIKEIHVRGYDPPGSAE